MASVEYGKTLGEYEIDELKALLAKEEQRLTELKTALHDRTAARAGYKVKVDKKGGVTRVFTAKETQAVKDVFDRIDVDKSGDLTLDELEKVVDELGCGLSDQEVKAALHELDTDQNGTVNWEEFFAWWSSDINRSKYKAGALSRLRGRITAQEHSSTGLSNLRLSSDPSKEHKKSEIDFAVEVGDYNTADATFFNITATPNTAKELDESIAKCDSCTWLSNPMSPEHELWRSYKDMKREFVGSGSFSIAVRPGAKSTVENVFKKLQGEYDKALIGKLNEECDTMDDEALELLEKFEIVKNKTISSVANFRKQCTRLGQYLNVNCSEMGQEIDCDKPSTLPEDSEDNKLLAALVELTSADQCEDFIPALAVTIEDTELVVNVMAYTSKETYDTAVQCISSLVGNDIEGYVKKALGEVRLTMGVGGNFSKHANNVLEGDAKLLDMLGWGFMYNFKASYVPSILEAVLSTVEKENVMLPSFAASLFQKFTSRVKVRNPYNRLGEIIDYLIADARCTFAAHSGVNEDGEGYKWGKEADEQLDAIREWGHFFLKSVNEKARLSTPIFSKQIGKIFRSAKRAIESSPMDNEQIGGWDMLQQLKVALGKINGVSVKTPYVKVDLEIQGEVVPLEFIPSEAVLKGIAEKTRKDASDPVHQEECDRRYALLKDLEYSEYVNEKFSEVKEAMEHIEALRGGRAMAVKDGLLFVTGIIKILSNMAVPTGSGSSESAFLVLMGQPIKANSEADSDDESGFSESS